jgi:hypothetical protein
MSREPLIASRVQKLFIRAWFVELLYKRDSKSTSKTFFGRLIRSLRSYFIKKPWNQRQDKCQTRNVKGRTYGSYTDSLSSKDIIHSMIKAINGMTNVTELYFECLPLNKDTCIFLTSARTAFDTNLRKLVLRGQVCKFKQLLAISNFNHVRELEFHFDCHPNTITSGGKFNMQLPQIPSGLQATDIQDLLETVVPFINHHRTSLNSLTISSSSTMDLSNFFKALLPMPALRQFRARIYFDKNCLQDVSGILQFLKAHSITLLRVELSPNLPQRAEDRNQKLLEKQLDWLRLNELLLNSLTVLSGLESLEIPYVSPAKTVPLLCRSRDTLTRLYLTDHFLTKDEVAEVVGIFSHRPFEMQHVHIQVKKLDTSLLYLLAIGLPGLFSLVLVLDVLPTVSDLYYHLYRD